MFEIDYLLLLGIYVSLEILNTDFSPKNHRIQFHSFVFFFFSFV